ncbi:MAG: NlpC/P60 family protein [Gaiellaceae bacterium]
MSNASARRAPAFLVGLAAALLIAGSATAEPASITGKQAEAQRVLGQIQEIDSSLAKAAEAYNLANIKLDRIEQEQKRNARLLRIARTNHGRAQKALEARLVALYTSSDQGSTIEVLLGATSLDDLISRLETVDRVSSQDSRVLGQVRSFKGQVQKHRSQLVRARTKQSEIVAARAAYKAQVEQRLAQRRALLSSIQGEIARLQAAERARAQEAARVARIRLASQAAVPATALGFGVAAETSVAAVAPPSRYGGVVGIAMQYLGVPYRWGGASPSGFDCSGFIMYVYAKLGVSLPHNAAAQYAYGTPVSRDQLAPGDLVFFDGLGHNGIYIGGGQFIHAPHSGDVVKISSLSDSWYARTWVGARRI